jgi:hypothetical protein
MRHASPWVGGGSKIRWATIRGSAGWAVRGAAAEHAKARRDGDCTRRKAPARVWRRGTGGAHTEAVEAGVMVGLVWGERARLEAWSERGDTTGWSADCGGGGGVVLARSGQGRTRRVQGTVVNQGSYR